MKLKRALLVAVPLALLMTGARAQDDAGEQVAVLDEYERSLALADYLGSDDLRASELLGATVRSAQGEELGEIEDLIVSRADDVVSAVISVGGFLGVGERPVAVPYEALRISPETRSFFLSMSREELAELPEYAAEERELESLLELRERAAGESSPERRSTVTDDGVLPPHRTRDAEAEQSSEAGASQTDGSQGNGDRAR